MKDTGARDQLLLLEQVKLLYNAISLSILVTFINATVLLAVEWNETNHYWAIVWFVGMLVAIVARVLVSFFYCRTHPEVTQAAYWGRLFTTTSIITAIVWGSSALLLFPENSIAHQVFLAFIIGGMCAGAVTTLSSLLLPVFSFLLLAISPFIVRFLLLGSEMAHVMSGMLLLFLCMLAVSAVRMHRSIRENIELRMQSEMNAASLAESEERFRALFEGNKSVELIIDPDDGRILRANHAAEQFYGYSNAQLLSMNISDINILSDEQVHAEMDLAAEEKRDHFIFKHRLASGDIRDVEVHSGPICWHEQKVLYSIVHDISNRVRAEYAIKRNAEILEMAALGTAEQKIYDAICQMYEVLHPEIRICILRLKGNRLFHCSAPSLPDAYCKAVDGVEIGASVGSCGTAAFLAERVIVEDISTDPLWADYKELALAHGLHACCSEPVFGSDGAILGTFAMYSEQPDAPGSDALTDIKYASGLVSIMMERERRNQLLGMLSQAVEQAGESVVITDVEGTIEYVNSSFERMTGYTSAEVLGKNPRVVRSGNQTDEFYQRLWDTITKGKIWHGSIVNRRKDGSQYPAMMSIAPILDSSGQITHYVALQQDMTTHDMLEEKFRQAQKMEAIGTLVGGIAHDFNNMLAGMTGNLYLAKSKVADFPDVVDRLTTVETLGFRASDMIKQLLTFARKEHVEMQPFGLTSFIKESSRLNEATIPENISFHRTLCAAELVVKGDATQLQQVLMNLLSNARDAVAGVAEPTISLQLEEYEADTAFISGHPKVEGRLFAHLTVTDNGAGINEEDKVHIFDPFYTTKGVGTGTGLGLSMVYGAVQSHGGVIEVESTPGQGSSFHIYLPLVAEHKASAVTEAASEVESGHGELILLVDDNANIRSTGKAVLESIGYRVVEAADGLQGVEQFTANRDSISLIIMDVVMPRLGGVGAAERIRAFCPDVKIIFATGYDKDDALKGEMPSGEVILPKPYNVVKLSRMIREQLHPV